MRKKKEIWYELTLNKLLQYESFKARAEYLQEELAERCSKVTINYCPTPLSKGKSDQVGNLAQYRLDIEQEISVCMQEINSIDRGVSMLNAVEQLVIRTKYLENNKDSYAWRTLSLYGKKNNLRLNSRDTYYRLKESAIEKLARIFGFMNTGYLTVAVQKPDVNSDEKTEASCYNSK